MFVFGDGFDCYATMADPVAGYWDSGLGLSAGNTLVAGRFAGSQAVSMTQTSTTFLLKNSGQNDAVHHIIVAFRQGSALSGAQNGLYLQLADAATNQCCIVFRSDGAILLQSGTVGGATLATYATGVTAANTWTAFEFEVIISNTVGRFRARKNGNTSDDFDSGATLNTRPGANSYANRLFIAIASNLTAAIDDILWRSDASAVPWVGDIRCYTRMPASDVQAQFARAPAAAVQQIFSNVASLSASVGVARYTPFTAAYDGTISTATISLTLGVTGNMKTSIFASSGTQPTSVLGSANVLANPATGVNTLTFGTPVAVVKGTQYWIGFDFDTTGASYTIGSTTPAVTSTTAYASFPVASPVVTTAQAPVYCTVTIATTTNYAMVSETLQDGTTSYVFDSTLNDADFYAIAPLSGTPSATIAVITRGFVQKSDAGTRSGAVQIRSGGTTVASPSTALSTSFGWLWRADVVDPATGAAWTATGVNNCVIGPTVTV